MYSAFWRPLYAVILGVLVATVGFSAPLAFAGYEGPRQPFPDGNPPAPLDTGIVGQTKAGWIGFSGFSGTALRLAPDQSIGIGSGPFTGQSVFVPYANGTVPTTVIYPAAGGLVIGHILGNTTVPGKLCFGSDPTDCRSTWVGVGGGGGGDSFWELGEGRIVYASSVNPGVQVGSPSILIPSPFTVYGDVNVTTVSSNSTTGFYYQRSSQVTGPYLYSNPDAAAIGWWQSAFPELWESGTPFRINFSNSVNTCEDSTLRYTECEGRNPPGDLTYPALATGPGAVYEFFTARQEGGSGLYAAAYYPYMKRSSAIMGGGLSAALGNFSRAVGIGTTPNLATPLLVAGRVGVDVPSGWTTPSAGKIASFAINEPALAALSGVSNKHTSIAIGRTAVEANLGVAALAGNYSEFSTPGDTVLHALGEDLILSGRSSIRFAIERMPNFLGQVMTIDPVGKIGIGTEPGETPHLVTVAGSINTSGGFFKNGVEITGGGGGGTSQWSGTPPGPISYTGAGVGIGTLTPASRLEVVQPGTAPAIIASGNRDPMIQVVGGATVVKLQINSDGGKGLVGTHSNNSFALYTNNAERVRITETGNVGVGIGQSVDPAARLAVNGTGATGTGSPGDALAAFANSGTAAVYAEQANPSGYALYASGKSYLGGDTNVGAFTLGRSSVLGVYGDLNLAQAQVSIGSLTYLQVGAEVRGNTSPSYNNTNPQFSWWKNDLAFRTEEPLHSAADWDAVKMTFARTSSQCNDSSLESPNCGNATGGATYPATSVSSPPVVYDLFMWQYGSNGQWGLGYRRFERQGATQLQGGNLSAVNGRFTGRVGIGGSAAPGYHLDVAAKSAPPSSASPRRSWTAARRTASPRGPRGAVAGRANGQALLPGPFTTRAQTSASEPRPLARATSST
ncbi:MAG: hypothetical protein AAB601_03030 [Patescibacteria group bacterium]